MDDTSGHRRKHAHSPFPIPVKAPGHMRQRHGSGLRGLNRDRSQLGGVGGKNNLHTVHFWIRRRREGLFFLPAASHQTNDGQQTGPFCHAVCFHFLFDSNSVSDRIFCAANTSATALAVSDCAWARDIRTVLSVRSASNKSTRVAAPLSKAKETAARLLADCGAMSVL